MDEPQPYPPSRLVVLAVVAFGGGLILAILVSGSIVAAQGWELDVTSAVGAEAGRTAMQFGQRLLLDDLRPPGFALALLNLPLWVGLIGVPLLDRRNGLNWRRDLGWTMRVVDVPLGLVVGVATQFVLIPLYEIVWLVVERQDVGQVADDLVAHVDGPVDVIAFVAMTVVMAPLAEEIVYRGLLYRGIRDMEASHHSMAVGLAVVASSLVFAISHFQFLQFPGLFLFGVVAAVLFQHTGRLATAIWAHIGFNATTVVLLLSS
ncbi:MAG: CPBP family intramembrane metalloprotease [Acidimicrobiales bacterium]|nr:CPBP family intramembrane metalloprotease [Acidimicrobiales bacterium]